MLWKKNHTVCNWKVSLHYAHTCESSVVQLDCKYICIVCNWKLFLHCELYVRLQPIKGITWEIAEFTVKSHFPTVQTHVCCKITREFKRIITFVTIINLCTSMDAPHLLLVAFWSCSVLSSVSCLSGLADFFVTWFGIEDFQSTETNMEKVVKWKWKYS